MSVTNVSTTMPASMSVPISVNATKPTSSIVPAISGFKGAATSVQGQSVFALGSLLFMATLLI